MDLVALLIGFIAGLAVVLLLFVSQQRKQRLWQQQTHELQLQLVGLQAVSQRLEDAQQDGQQKQQQVEQLQRTLAARSDVITELETRLETERSHHEEKLALLEQARGQLSGEFQNLANKIFEEKSARFSAQNKDQLGHLLTPLREQLGEFKRRVEDSYDRESKDRRALAEQVNQLKQLNQQMSQDAVNLTNALKGDNKAQGNWGEVILAQVLEQSGLRQGYEFETQVSLRQDGKRYQPDVIVHLPDGKDIIVDSKVSLVAYEKYCNEVDETVRQQHLLAHIQSLHGHIRGLSEKAYQNLEGVRTLDFVLLFIPVEGAFLAAMEKQPSLFGKAFERNIVLVSPSTLLVTLRTIHNIWRNEYQHQNAEEIARRGAELYDKFVGFVETLDELGLQLDRTQQSYELARKRLATGRGNLIGQAKRLEQLGVSGKKKLKAASEDTAGSNDLLEVNE